MEEIEHMHPSSEGIGSIEFIGEFSCIKDQLQELSLDKYQSFDSYSLALKEEYKRDIHADHDILVELLEELFRGKPSCFIKSMVYQEPIWYLGVKRSNATHLLPLKRGKKHKELPSFCSDLVISCISLLAGFSEMKVPITDYFLFQPMEFSKEDVLSWGFESSVLSMPCLQFYAEDGAGLYVDSEGKIVRHRSYEGVEDTILATSFLDFLKLAIAGKKEGKYFSQL